MQACVADLIYYFIPENNKLKYEKYEQSEGTVKISDKPTRDVHFQNFPFSKFHWNSKLLGNEQFQEKVGVPLEFQYQ